MKVIDINQENFDREVLHSDRLTIVDFWAPWCGPCRVMGPILDDVAAGFGDRLKVTKLNVDENSAAAERFTVTSIPTLIYFQNGKVVNRTTGAVPKARLESRIDELLAVPQVG